MENLIDKIVLNSNKLEEINNIQEVLKFNTLEKTNNRKILFNSIYIEVSSVCIVASSHFKAVKAKQDMFNFNKIVGITYKNPKFESMIKIEAEDQAPDYANNFD